MPAKKRKSAQSSADSKGKGKKSQSPAHEESPGHPDDIFPLIVTSVTQGLFGCRIAEDVTGESPYKLLKKDDIIQDMKTRAAVSDFSPVKQIVLDYPEDEILLVFDKDFTYESNFYLVLTPEAKDRILNPPEPETVGPEVFENEINKTPEPKSWISLGSEQEIDEESVKESRSKLRYKFSRVRRKFGAPVCFSNSETVTLGWPSYQDSRFSIKQMQRDCGMQAAPVLQSSSAQTQWKFKRNNCTQYMPRELSDEEKENILQAESLKDFLNSVTPRVLQALQQEEIVNVFIDEWKALRTAAVDGGDWSETKKVSKDLILHQAFTDQQYTKGKKIRSINWHPTIDGVIAVALIEKKEEQLSESTAFIDRPPLILFYTYSDPTTAALLLECPGDVFAFEFCPSDPNIIVGGCRNGQVVLWDISAHVTHLQGTQPSSKRDSVNTDKFHPYDNKENKTPVVRYCAASAFESSHKAPITDVHWLPPTFEVTKTGLPVENKYNLSVQVVTCSPDCTIMFWDVRSDRKQNVDQKTQLTPYSIPDTFKHMDQTWEPLFRVSLPRIDTSGEYAPLKFSLEHYTCNSNNTSKTTEEAKQNDDSSEVVQDYSQLRAASAKTLKTLDDVNTKLYVGTEDGEIVYTDWKLGKEESGRLQSAKPLQCFNIHHWVVNTVQRSPFFKDIILTTGGWNFAIWKEGVMDGPIVKSPRSERVCTVGCWSLSRPAVFFIGREGGSIEVWNLLEKPKEPAQVHANFTDGNITCIEPWTASSKQHFLAVTDDLGMVAVLEIPKTLCVPSRSESLRVKKYFEQEENWLKDCLKREEQWAKQMKEAEELKKKKTPSSSHDKDKTPQEFNTNKTESDRRAQSLEEKEAADLKEYREYLVLEENILKSMGLWRATAET